MPKKKKKSRKKKRKELKFSSETIKASVGIALFVISLILLMSAFGFSGIAGEKIYRGLSFLFGVGYFLFPVALVFLGVALFKESRTRLGWERVLSSLIFFLSSLAVVETSFPEAGGTLGRIIAFPFLNLLDVYASLLVFWALIFISLILLFDSRPSLSHLKSLLSLGGKKEELTVFEDDVAINTGVEENEEDEIPEEGEDHEEEKEDESVEFSKEVEETSKRFGGLFGRKTTDSDYTAPPVSLLEKRKGKPDTGDIKANANIIKRTLANFGINVEMDEVSIGPSVTRYAMKPAEGVRLSKILGLQNNLELALAAHPVRIEAPIPGKSLVGVEVPNSAKTTVGLASVVSSDAFKKSGAPLTVGLGRGISGNTYIANVSKMPHLLIAGATGAGKSVTIHALVTSLLYRNSPQDLKFIMVDPKRVELTLYNGIPHLLTPVITDSKKAVLSLKWAASEMERRYNILEKHRVRDIESYHKNILGKAGDSDDEDAPGAMPYIIVVIDELADIMQSYPREFESGVVRLAQMSRAVGIHLILSTQRPSVNVITGLIKANIPARIALQVASQVDSRTILDTAGAEKLLGAGDMLYLSGDMSKPVRIQSAYVSEKEVRDVVSFLKKNNEDEIGEEISLSEDDSSSSDIFSSLGDEDEEDELYEEARDTVIKAGKGSTSYLQRKLRIGYSRAARLMDMLEDNGVVGPQDGSKPREVLVEEGFGEEEDIEEDD